MIETILLVTGVVQGVGFRPFCARLALDLDLRGSVKNTSDGVFIRLQGDVAAVDLYRQRLQEECPAIAFIQSVDVRESRSLASGELEGNFVIERSQRLSEQKVLIPPDIATCPDCIREMEDPGDPRFGYPFINCTNCGPRYSIVKELPYDRSGTTMSCFPMCDRCASEYKAPEDRRFHAQPNACPDCGPRLWLTDSKGNCLGEGNQALEACIGFLKEGRVMAIKGLGGFHLACDPFNDAAVEVLRRRKKRPHKPFALMVRDLGEARRVAAVREEAAELMVSPRAPIVICPARKDGGLSPKVAPGQNSLGIMLPYTPLHHLLLQRLSVLIMTSANLTDEPLVSGNREALRELAGFADFFLFHDRDINMKIDDSVVSFSGTTPIMIRRARGYVPQPFILSRKVPSILAAGAEMKVTFSVTHDHYLFPSQYLGDLKEMKSFQYYGQCLRHFLGLYDIRPRFLVKDQHPQYLSGAVASRAAGPFEDVLQVQHHHAHMAACLLENQQEERAVGLILDGTGYGTDGTIWGGEILVGDALHVERAGYLFQARLPGGERAIEEPWRFALALLCESLDTKDALGAARRIWPSHAGSLEALVATLESAPLTSSAGRLFDGVSALLGIREKVTFDGQAAMELEARAAGAGVPLPFHVFRDGEGRWVVDWRPAVRCLLELRESASPGELAAAFHLGLARTLTDVAFRVSEARGIPAVALSGGVWQNRRLLALTLAELRRSGRIPLVHKRVSPNDECISVGQAYIGSLHWAHQ